MNYLWILDTSLFDAVWYSFPALQGDLLYFSTMNPLIDRWELNYYAFDRLTGRQVWKYADYAVWPYRKPLDTRELFEQNMYLIDYLAPSLWKKLVIYTSGDSMVRALDKKTGALVWEQQFNSITTSAPTVAGDFVYFGIDSTGSGYFGDPPKVVCLSARTGRKMWEMETDGRLLSAPVIAQNWMIFGTDTNHFYVLEALF